MISDTDEAREWSYELGILRKGGVSEQSLNNTVANSELLQQFNILVSSRRHKAFKAETQSVEGPG